MSEFFIAEFTADANHLTTIVKPIDEARPEVEVFYKIIQGGRLFCPSQSETLMDGNNNHTVDSDGITIIQPITFCPGSGRQVRIQVTVQKPGDPNSAKRDQRLVNVPFIKVQAASLSLKPNKSESTSFQLDMPPASQKVRLSVASHWNLAFVDDDKEKNQIEEKKAEASPSWTTLDKEISFKRTEGNDPGKAVRITATIYDSDGNLLARRHCLLDLS